MVSTTPCPIYSREKKKNRYPFYRRLCGRHGLSERPARTEILYRLRSPFDRVNSMFCKCRSLRYPVIIRLYSSLLTAYKRVTFHNTYIHVGIYDNIEDE